MKKLYVCIIVLSSLYPVKYSFANTKYVYNENERQCFLQKNNKKSYIFAPVNSIGVVRFMSIRHIVKNLFFAQLRNKFT